MDPTVEVHGEADIWSDCLTHGGGSFCGQIDFAGCVEVHQLFGRVHFERRKALRHGFFGGFSNILRAVPTNPRIDADRMPHCATHQLINRHAVALALDIPQCLIDARDGAHRQRAAAVESAAVEHLPDVFDVVGVTTDEIFAQLVHGGGSGRGAALDDGFTPAADAFVGADFEEQPTRRDGEQFDTGDFHRVLLVATVLRVFYTASRQQPSAALLRTRLRSH